jgi:hypothetical protein
MDSYQCCQACDEGPCECCQDCIEGDCPGCAGEHLNCPVCGGYTCPECSGCACPENYCAAFPTCSN